MRLAILLSLAASCAAQPLLQHTDVFVSGSEGYHSFRIPAIVTAADGSLVAFAEGRRDNRTDPGGGDIDLVARRSTDHGATWSALQIVDDPGEKWAASNPTPVLDRSNGRLWIAYNRWEPGFGTDASRPGTTNNQTWLRWSDDHGKSWSAARDITRDSRDFENTGALFLGPGGAIQTRSGRLILPSAMKFDAYSVWAQPAGSPQLMNVLRAYAIYSDDHGKTWLRGELVRAFTNENQMVELADGAILIDARQGNGDHRWIAISQDGGATWSAPRLGERVTAVATAIERFDAGRLIWTGPAGPGRRKLVVRVSRDEGQTFSTERVLYGGIAAYSDLAMLSDGTAGVLWERGVSALSQFITFTRFNREFIE